jgi:diguanylate cyclase (GGDEF)-like protein
MTFLAEENRIERLRTAGLRTRAVDVASDVDKVGAAGMSAVKSPTTNDNHSHRIRWIGLCYTILGILLGVYIVSLFVRRSNQEWTWLDGWLVCAFECVASLLCILRGLERKPGRIVPLFLGLSLLSWSIGDIVLTYESVGTGNAPSVSVADVFYLLFYPLAYVATVLLFQRGVGRLTRPNWLDGVVAGLGASSLCAAFAFHSILHITGGNSLSTATNMAYPVGDILLLLLVFGGTVMLSGRGTRQWYLLAVGLIVIVIGDTFNLFQSTGTTSRFGSEFNSFAWPTAIFLMSLSVWLPARVLDPLRTQKLSGLALPGVASLCGLAILVAGTFHTISRVAIGLAIATLMTVGVRLAISARSLRILTEERHRQAHTDELTGLGNRRQLFHVLELFFAEQHGAPGALRRMAFLFVDLNHFKEINDSFGHPAGDELLRQLGPRITHAVGNEGLVVRLGGDELAVLLMDADAKKSEEVAQRILVEIEKPFVLHKINASVGASIGIALVPTDAQDGPGLLWCADVAMYRAKLGSTPYVFYDQHLDGGEDQVRLVDELRVAVKEGNLVLHYQPLLDLRTGEILAVEALVRWPHPTLGLIPPMKFLPLAEEAGLMWPLTTWVLNEAVAQCAAWRIGERTMAVSVNVATSDLLEDGFIDLIGELLERYSLPADALVIEITETSIISDFVRSQAVILQLRDLGVVVSIDDFGAGFTSLAYLSSLAVGELKLDRSFIMALAGENNHRDLEIVRATINLGHEMGLRVVAEGIEDVATLELLSDLGCDLAQGYFISRPTPANKLAFQSSPSPTPEITTGRLVTRL